MRAVQTWSTALVVRSDTLRQKKHVHDSCMQKCVYLCLFTSMLSYYAVADDNAAAAAADDDADVDVEREALVSVVLWTEVRSCSHSIRKCSLSESNLFLLNSLHCIRHSALHRVFLSDSCDRLIGVH